MTDWISVDDGLPQEDTTVFVYGEPYSNSGPAVTVAFYMADHGRFAIQEDTFSWFIINETIEDSMCDGDYCKSITHWMLPEPPK